MAYCNADDIIDMLKDDVLNPIIGNEYIEDPEARRSAIRPLAEDAIADADAEIDGYLMKRYPVPISPPPSVISKYSKDVAIYNLVSRSGIDEGERESNYLTRYKNAITFLTKVAKGEVDIVKEGMDQTKSAATGFKITGNTRLFSRNTMKGF